MTVRLFCVCQLIPGRRFEILNAMTAPSIHPPLRWGILSTARIIRKNWPAMLESGAATLVALASRDIDKAQGFIDGMQSLSPWPVKPVAHGSYEFLLADPAIDAVYIPLPTGIRKEWVVRAAQAGKHVLCEKPCAVSSGELREMLACCEQNGVRFMDGVRFMHDPRFARLREILDRGETVGEIKRISSAFSFLGGEDFASGDIRAQASLEPTGCLGDLGWYCIRAFLWAMAWELPRRVSGRVLGTSDGSAINDFSGEMDFASGATAAFHCSFLAPGQMWLNLSGTRGSVRMADFISPSPESDTDWEVNHQRVARPADSGMSSAARMFVRFAGGDGPWPEISLKTQLVQDACELSSRLGRAVVLDGETYR